MCFPSNILIYNKLYSFVISLQFCPQSIIALSLCFPSNIRTPSNAATHPEVELPSAQESNVARWEPFASKGQHLRMPFRRLKKRELLMQKERGFNATSTKLMCRCTHLGLERRTHARTHTNTVKSISCSSQRLKLHIAFSFTGPFSQIYVSCLRACGAYSK